jgi:transcriptional regulator with XRE-family HTH domain
MIMPDPLTVLDCQVLLQLGDRLQRLRKARGLGTVEMAKQAGISRMTLSAVESGDPSSSMGSYLRVMAVLGLSGELALVAADSLQPGQAGVTVKRSRRIRPGAQVVITADQTRHRIQDQQSLALHRQAVRAVQQDQTLLDKATNTLSCWLADHPNSRSTFLWREWEEILKNRSWRKILRPSQKGQQLRQASPLVTVLPESIRLHVVEQVSSLKNGIPHP